jgi:hypothetical protein
LLAYMTELRAKHGTWITKPGELNAWWRQRANMHLTWSGDRWSVTGEGHERAVIAYAKVLQDGRLVYRLGDRDATADWPGALATAGSLNPDAAFA